MTDIVVKRECSENLDDKATLSSPFSKVDLPATTMRLLEYCRANEWAGYDPYDGLNSRLFDGLPFLNYRLPRIAIIQALKRSAINIRPLLMVSKKQNPKALGLFLASMLKLSRSGVSNLDSSIREVIDCLIKHRAPSVPYWCWGYSFPWQTRTHLVPAGAPNVVCTAFVADALLDAYEQGQGNDCLQMAISAAEYVVNELFWAEGFAAGFSYPTPGLRVQIHNANFLAAALLARVYAITGDTKVIGPALKATRCSTSAQKPDGSWEYGDGSARRWVDNFHTGYNLCALRTIGKTLDTDEFEPYVRRGFDFYRQHFFENDEIPRYFHDRTYPVDIHCVAQSIITLLAFRDLCPDNARLAESVLRWSVKHMWDKRGYFYYRVLRMLTIRTPYMRWSQSWMLLALATIISEFPETVTPRTPQIEN